MAIPAAPHGAVVRARGLPLGVTVAAKAMKVRFEEVADGCGTLMAFEAESVSGAVRKVVVAADAVFLPVIHVGECDRQQRRARHQLKPGSGGMEPERQQ